MIDWLEQLTRRQPHSARRDGAHRYLSTPLPSLRGEVVVLVQERGSARVALLRKSDRRRLVVAGEHRGAGDTEDAFAQAIACLRRSVGRLPRSALVVTSSARLSVRHPLEHSCGGVVGLVDGDPLSKSVHGWVAVGGSVESPELRVVSASMDRVERDEWRELLRRAALDLEGIYPLGGSPVALLDPSLRAGPMLCLQVEREFIALAETFGGGLHAIQIAPRASVDSVSKECLDLLGPGCEELWLCGSVADLSALGYELVTRGQTWVRFLRPVSNGSPDSPESLVALGVARHAFEMAPVDALACVPAA